MSLFPGSNIFNGVPVNIDNPTGSSSISGLTTSPAGFNTIPPVGTRLSFDLPISTMNDPLWALKLPPSVDSLREYVSAWHSLGKSDRKVPIGAPISLVALLPTPGQELPAITDIVATKSLLPVTSAMRIRWVVSVWKSTDANDATKGSYEEVRPGSSVEDTGAAYQVLEGSVTSPLLKLVPWPDPTVQNGIARGIDRRFRIALQVFFWWPGKAEKTTPDVEKVILSDVTVPRWSTIFEPETVGTGKTPDWRKTKLSTSVGSNPLQTTPADLHPTLFFQNMFSLNASTLTPDAGQAVDLIVQYKDKLTSTVPRVVQSIVEQTPNVQVQAALDAGAYFKGMFESIGKTLPDDFSKKTNSAISVDVQRILTSALSIPIAVAVNGSTLTKTMLPTTDELVPVLNSIEGVAGLAGTVPIGNLVSKIAVLSRDLVFTATNVDKTRVLTTSFRRLESAAELGLSIIPIPHVASLRNGLSFTNYSIKVEVPLSIQLPGSLEPLLMSLPSLELIIRVPDIQIPQIFMAFHDLDLTGNDVYYCPDPYSNEVLPDAKLISNRLSTITRTFNTLIKALPLEFMESVNKANDFRGWTNLISTASLMLTALTKNQFKSAYNFNTDPNWPDCYRCDLGDAWWWGDNTNLPGGRRDKNISSFLWLGAPTVSGTDHGDWRLLLVYDDFGAEKGVIAMPFSNDYPTRYNPTPRDDVLAVTAWSAENLSVQDAMVYNNYRDAPHVGLLVGNGTKVGYDWAQTWNDKIKYLVWTKTNNAGESGWWRRRKGDV